MQDTYSYIQNVGELHAFIQRAQSCELLAIDTEFLRESSYYPKLCLLQMATEEEVVVLDPFEVKDLHPLASLLQNKGILKLFHAGTQDIEILYNELGVLPEPLFDTQIAATMLGFTLQIGYGALVQNVCGVTLKKADSFTDWSRRPLTNSQLSYAADDVIYLPKLYRTMSAQLKAQGRLGWLDDEFDQLVDPHRYETNAYDRYLKLKRVGQLSRRQLSAARELAAWREETAIKRNLPRKWVMTDEQVVEACRRGATDLDQLFMVRGMREKLSLSDARSACRAIERGLQAPKEEWPLPPSPGKSETNVDVQVDALSAIVRLRAKEHGIAFQALAAHDDLIRIARGYTDVETLKGWRRDLVGRELLAFVQGKLQLSIENGSLKVTNKE